MPSGSLRLRSLQVRVSILSILMTDESSTQTEESDGVARIYEVGFLLVPTLPEADVPREFGLLKEMLEKGGAEVIGEEMPRSRILAYPIRPRKVGKPGEYFKSAYFGWVKFSLDAQRIKEIETACETMEKILRFLVVKTVRESTLSVQRVARQEFRRDGAVAPKDAPASVVVSETELDKSLEKLIAE